MSLIILGSLSRTTSNIIHELAKNSHFNRITVADLLPTYTQHHRFYRIQRELENLGHKVNVELDRLTNINDVQKIHSYDSVLYVTHDYYYAVTAKTKLMELVGQVGKNRDNLIFATPVEYDHFGYQNPELNYLSAERRVLELNPRATFIRSDVQDKTETFAYFNKQNKNLLEQQVFNSKFHFAPFVTNSYFYAKVVADNLVKGVQGKRILVQGKENKDPIYVDYNNEIVENEYIHAKDNIIELAQKYNSISFQGYERIHE